MTFRSALHEYLRDVIDVPVHDGRLPTRPMLPALSLRFISATPEHTHSGPSSLLERRVQIDAYANNDKEADALATRLIHALDGYHGPMGSEDIGYAFLATDLEAEPDELKGGQIIYRRIVDFHIAYQEVRMVPVPVGS